MGDRLGQRRAVVVVGEAGVGKTALLRAAASASGRRIHEGGGLSTLSSLSYLPVTRALGSEPKGGDHAAVAEDVARRVDGGVLVLDDLHWADVDTLTVLKYLVGSVTLLGAVRSGDPGAGGALSHAEAAGADVIELSGLGDEDAADLVRLKNPELTGDDLNELLDRARGNPLLLEELATGEPSPTLASSLRARLRRMPETARDAAARMALLARPADVRLLGDGALELVAAGLALEGSEGIAFRHALLGETVMSELSEPGRRELHANLARVLPDPGEAGHHYALAGDREAARAKALEAAASAPRAAEQAGHLRLAASCSDGPEATELRLQAAEALLAVDLPEEALRLLEGLVSADAETQARIHLLTGRGRGGLGDMDALERETAAGLRLVAGTRSELELDLRLERVQPPLWVPDAVEARTRASEAYELATDVGRRQARALLALCMAAYLSDPDEAVCHARAAREQASETGDVYVEQMATRYESTALGWLGRIDEVIDLLARTRERARGLGLRAWEAEHESCELLTQAYYGEGPSPGLAERMRRHVANRPPWLIEEQSWLHLADIVGELGRDAEARGYLTTFETATGWAGYLKLFVTANLDWLAGRAESAASLAREASVSTPWPVAIEEARMLEAWALFDLGRPPIPYSVDGEGFRPLGARPVIEGLGLLATPGDEVRATLLLRQAVDELQDVRLGLRTRWGAGEAARRAGDLAGARATLLTLEEELEARSMQPLLRRVRRSLRLAGVVRAQRNPADGLLSAREREVLLLVAEGLTSLEIAIRLALSRATVESHVRSAMRKLGASTRRQAAALVAASP
jgi:DNA-binding CsgD family transcriptional regulator